MANPTPPPLDIVSVAVTIAAVLFSPEAAAMAGPYAVIILGAIAGGSWSASRLALGGRLETAKYLAGIVTLALLLSVPAASVATAYYDGLTFNYLLGPVAFAIGALGPDGLLRCGRALARLKRWPGGPPQDPPNPPPTGEPR